MKERIIVGADGRKYITTEPQRQQRTYTLRKWQGLTAKDLAEIPPSCYEGAIWADAKLKEKNT